MKKPKRNPKLWLFIHYYDTAIHGMTNAFWQVQTAAHIKLLCNIFPVNVTTKTKPARFRHVSLDRGIPINVNVKKLKKKKKTCSGIAHEKKGNPESFFTLPYSGNHRSDWKGPWKRKRLPL